MKTKKSNRLLSAFLAILMVFAVCPMVALSAQEPTVQDVDSITYWNGTVPYDGQDFSDFGMTIPEFIMDKNNFYMIDKTDFDAHFVAGNGTLGVKDEIGLAMLSLITNAPTLILDYDDMEDGIYYDSSAAANPSVYFLQNFPCANGGKITIRLLKDMYLNAPDAYENQIAPLFWQTTDNGSSWLGLTVDGNGYSVNGWYMNTTVSDNAFSSVGFIGMMPTWEFKVQDLALIDMEVNVTTAEPLTETVFIGGIVGGGGICRGGGEYRIENCYVDLNVDFVSWLLESDGWMSTPGVIWDGGIRCKMEIGGLAGSFQHKPNSTALSTQIKKVTLINNVIQLDYNINTGWGRLSGITGGVVADTTNVTVDNVIVAKMFNSGEEKPELGNGSIWAGVSPTDATHIATDIWTVGTLHANMTDPSNRPNLSLANMASDEFFSINGFGMDGMYKSVGLVPVPATLAENANVMASVSELLKESYISDLNMNVVTPIATAEELISYVTLANELGKGANIKLIADIDLDGKTMPVIQTLKGLDGQGHIIANYTQTIHTANDWNQIGGFCTLLAGNVTDVAFTNYNVTFTDTVAHEYQVGGLFGGVGDNLRTVSNVYLQGHLTVEGQITGGNARLGYFLAPHGYDASNVGITMNNCIFVGEVKGITANYFGGNIRHPSTSGWGAIIGDNGNGAYKIVAPERQVKLNNCYAIPYTVNESTGAITLTSHRGNNVGVNTVALRSCYQSGMSKGIFIDTGAQTPYDNVVDVSGVSLKYLAQFNIGNKANNNLIGTATGENGIYLLQDFQGDAGTSAMKFSNTSNWYWYEDGTPIPAVFGESSESLSVKSLEMIEAGVKKTNFIGTQLRLDKEGLRFVGEFDVAGHIALANGKTVEFGFLILPTAAITSYGQILEYTNPNVLKISTTDADQLLFADDPRLNGITVQNSHKKVLLAVMTQIPSAVLKSSTDFTVQPFVAYLDAQNKVVTYVAESANVQKFSGVGVANTLCKDVFVSDEVKKQVCQVFEMADSFRYTWDTATDVMKAKWSIYETTVQIGYGEPITFSKEERATYNAYYMERNAVMTFQEEINRAFGTSIPLVQNTGLLPDATRINAYVDSSVASGYYDISMAENCVTVRASHYATLEEGLEYLKAELIQNGGTLGSSLHVFQKGTIATSGISSTFSAFGADVNNYTLVWSDEFNASVLDYDRWAYDGSNPVKNVADVALSNKATTANGSLNINTTLHNGVYEQTKLITTYGTMNWNGGYLEMRGSIPFDSIGKWVSMWATSGSSALFIKEWKTDNGITGSIKPSDLTYGNGMGIEVDMVEVMAARNGAPTSVHLYPAELSQREQNSQSYVFSDESAALGYHTYGFFWNRDYMAFTVDGELYYTFHLKDTGTDATGQGYIDGVAEPYYSYGDFDPGKIALSLILQNDTFTSDYVATQSWVVGSSIEATGDPYNTTFSIDYIRLYQTEGDMLYLPRELGEGVDTNGNFNWNMSAYPSN